MNKLLKVVEWKNEEPFLYYTGKIVDIEIKNITKIFVKEYDSNRNEYNFNNYFIDNSPDNTYMTKTPTVIIANGNTYYCPISIEELLKKE